MKTNMRKIVHRLILCVSFGLVSLAALEAAPHQPVYPGHPGVGPGYPGHPGGGPGYPGYDRYGVGCKVRNLRGAEYFGRSRGQGPYAVDAACNQALAYCFSDSILPRTCHVVDTWVDYF